MNKLDCQRPYGRIVGHYEECAGAVYTQDGKFFDSYQNLIDTKGNSHETTNEKRPNEQVNDAGKRQEKNAEQEENAKQEKSHDIT